MIRLANVLIADSREESARALCRRLTDAGYHATSVRLAAEAEAWAATEHPDLILLGELNDAGSLDFGAMLKANVATSDIPVIQLAPAAHMETQLRALAANMDDVIDTSCDDDELFARLRPLVRLSTMHAELRQRARIAGQFGVAAAERAASQDDARPTLLLLGDVAIDHGALFTPGADVVTSTDLFEAEDLLSRRNFDAALVAFSAPPEGTLAFCAQVRNNPRLFNLPLVLLSADGNAEAYRRGATRVLPTGTAPILLRAVLLNLVRRQRLRWSIRTAFTGTLQHETRDASTGAYSRPFLDSYLAERLETAKAHGRHLSVIFFAAPSIDKVRAQFGADAGSHLTEQMGQWITGLLRAEDLTAAFGCNAFCVVLPDTPLAEAEVVMHRIAGVLTYTDFAVRDVYQPVKLWVQVGCTDAHPGDNLETLVERARRNLD